MRIDDNLIAAMPMRFNVYGKLLPTLAHTMWPAGQEFDFVHQAFLICQVVIVCFKPRLNNMLMRCPRTKDTYLAPMQNRLPQKRSCQISPPKKCTFGQPILAQT